MMVMPYKILGLCRHYTFFFCFNATSKKILNDPLKFFLFLQRMADDGLCQIFGRVDELRIASKVAGVEKIGSQCMVRMFVNDLARGIKEEQMDPCDFFDLFSQA